MPNTKKSRKSGHKAPRSHSNLEQLKTELLMYCNVQDAQLSMDQIFAYALASERFVHELDDLTRSDLFTFHSLIKNLISEIYEEDRLRRKGKI